MSEESRLGREQIETAYLLKQLITAGVRVVYYLEDRERTLDSPTDKILLAVSGFADEVERDKARQRTYDAMRRKAGAGHVTCPGQKPPRPDLCDPPTRGAGMGLCRHLARLRIRIATHGLRHAKEFDGSRPTRCGGG